MDLEDLAPDLRGDWSHDNKRGKVPGSMRAVKGSRGALAAAANGQTRGGATSAAKARASRIPITLPAISIQKRGDE